MMNTKNSTTEKGIQCYDCSKPIAGKKALECIDCGEFYCKDHVKANDSDHSSICFSCFRKKIHLDVTLELESQMIEAKTQLNSLKEKLKNCKKDLSNKKTTIERHQAQVKINEKTYTRKFETLEKKIEEEVQRGDNLSNTITNLNAALDDYKARENSTEQKKNSLEDEISQLEAELNGAKMENNKLKIEAQNLSDESKKYIQYISLRNTLCNSCKNRVKLLFKDEILEGNNGKESLIASVLQAERNMINQRNSLAPEMQVADKNGKTDDKACCCVI
ncbi:hypothetical protein SteCoe_33618 [Stentor coeruleus]|uniref:Uncharacterized protein n=1 Tax=Stentor coeruleus TaxID=5963 RepID=A0A1R2AWC9_9CILI|nr:hypothetical protein SteCoe_33618 [Stentor coeruleus]